MAYLLRARLALRSTAFLSLRGLSSANTANWDGGNRQSGVMSRQVSRANRLFGDLRKALDIKPSLHVDDFKGASSAFRDLAEVYSYSAGSSGYDRPNVNIADMQAVVDGIKSQSIKPGFSLDIYHVLKFASFEPTLNVSSLIHTLYGDIDRFVRKLGEDDLFNLAAGLSLHSISQEANLIMSALFQHCGSLRSQTPVAKRIELLRYFATSGVHPTIGDVELLCAEMKAVGVATVRTPVLCSFLRLLVRSHLGSHCQIDLAQEIVSRATPYYSSLLTPPRYHDALNVARHSGQLTEEVLQTVKEKFVPDASPQQCVDLIKMLFFVDQNIRAGSLVMALLKALRPHLGAVDPAKCCQVLRHVGRWEEFEDLSVATDILSRVASTQVSTKSAVDLLYGLAQLKVRSRGAVRANLLEFVRNNRIRAAELQPRTAVLLSIALRSYQLRVVPWLAELDAFLVSNVHQVGTQTQDGLWMVLEMYGHLDYPIPEAVCRQLPNAVRDAGLRAAVCTLWALWRSGQLPTFQLLERYYKLHEPSKLPSIMAGGVATHYQQLVAGQSDFNQRLPKLPSEFLLELFERKRRKQGHWLEAYRSSVVEAVGSQYVLTDAMSEGGNCCTLAFLQGTLDGQLVPWQPEYVARHGRALVVCKDNLPPDVVPVAVCAGREFDHCIGGEQLTLSANVMGTVQSLQSEGWKTLPFDGGMVKEGPDRILAALQSISGET